MHLNRIDYLLECYYLQQLTEAEWSELHDLLLQDDQETVEQAFIRLMEKYNTDQETFAPLETTQIERILAIDKVPETEIIIGRPTCFPAQTWYCGGCSLYCSRLWDLLVSTRI